MQSRAPRRWRGGAMGTSRPTAKPREEGRGGVSGNGDASEEHGAGAGAGWDDGAGAGMDREVVKK